MLLYFVKFLSAAKLPYLFAVRIYPRRLKAKLHRLKILQTEIYSITFIRLYLTDTLKTDNEICFAEMFILSLYALFYALSQLPDFCP
jgi:hypothetical protein